MRRVMAWARIHRPEPGFSSLRFPIGALGLCRIDLMPHRLALSICWHTRATGPDNRPWPCGRLVALELEHLQPVGLARGVRRFGQVEGGWPRVPICFAVILRCDMQLAKQEVEHRLATRLSESLHDLIIQAPWPIWPDSLFFLAPERHFGHAGS